MGADLPKLLRDQFQRSGVTPDRLFALTAHQLFALLFEPDRPAAGADRLDLLRRHNHDLLAAKGVAPSVPAWLWKGRKVPGKPDPRPQRGRGRP